MNSALTSSFIALGCILLLTLILVGMATEDVIEIVTVGLAVGFVGQLIGLCVVVAAVVQFFSVACDRKELSSKRLAWWVSIALLGLLLTHPHWGIGLAILAIVVSLVLVDGFGRGASADEESIRP